MPFLQLQPPTAARDSARQLPRAPNHGPPSQSRSQSLPDVTRRGQPHPDQVCGTGVTWLAIRYTCGAEVCVVCRDACSWVWVSSSLLRLCHLAPLRCLRRLAGNSTFKLVAAAFSPRSTLLTIAAPRCICCCHSRCCHSRRSLARAHTEQCSGDDHTRRALPHTLDDAHDGLHR